MFLFSAVRWHPCLLSLINYLWLDRDCLTCHYKANHGAVFFFKSGILFALKPIIFIPKDEIRQIGTQDTLLCTYSILFHVIFFYNFVQSQWLIVSCQFRSSVLVFVYSKLDILLSDVYLLVQECNYYGGVDLVVAEFGSQTRYFELIVQTEKHERFGFEMIEIDEHPAVSQFLRDQKFLSTKQEGPDDDSDTEESQQQEQAEPRQDALKKKPNSSSIHDLDEVSYFSAFKIETFHIILQI